MKKIIDIFTKLQDLDRRWIYLFMAIAIAVPLAISFDSKTHVRKPVISLYQQIDSYRDRDDRAIMIEFAHTASTMPELFPMEVALLRHCFERNINVTMLTFYPQAAPLIQYAIATVREEYPNIVSGEDYVNFGYKPAALYLPIILGMGEDIAESVETDSQGRNIANLPMMKEIKNYNEMHLIIQMSAAGYAQGWITYARGKFGADVACGVTAVIASDAYPFLQSGQLIGMLAGLKGAAEYEKLVDTFAMRHKAFSKEYLMSTYTNEKNSSSISDQKLYKFKKARIGMNAQSVAHIVIILFILIGNIGFFVTGQHKNEISGS